MGGVVALAASAVVVVLLLGLLSAARRTHAGCPGFRRDLPEEGPGSAVALTAASGVPGDEGQDPVFFSSEGIPAPVINPATGLLMIGGFGGLDTAGNPYGFDSSGHSSHAWPSDVPSCPAINPASGLPMHDCVWDVAGNPLGASSNDAFPCCAHDAGTGINDWASHSFDSW